MTHPFGFHLQNFCAFSLAIALRFQGLYLLGHHFRDSFHVFLVHFHLVNFVLAYDRDGSVGFYCTLFTVKLWEILFYLFVGGSFRLPAAWSAASPALAPQIPEAARSEVLFVIALFRRSALKMDIQF